MNDSPTLADGGGSICRRELVVGKDASISSSLTFFEVDAVFRRFLGRPTGLFALEAADDGAFFDEGTGAEVVVTLEDPET